MGVIYVFMSPQALLLCVRLLRRLCIMFLDTGYGLFLLFIRLLWHLIKRICESDESTLKYPSMLYSFPLK